MKAKLVNDAAAFIIWPMWLYHLKKVKERKKKAAKKAAGKGKKKNKWGSIAKANTVTTALKSAT